MSAARLRCALALGCVALLAVAARTERQAPGDPGDPNGAGVPSTDGQPEPAWAAQLHLHGPFSEGVGSVESHALVNRDRVDVLWWSEHDFRATSYRCVARFRFEELESPLADGEGWEPRTLRERRGQKWVAPWPQVGALPGKLRIVGEAYEGTGSLRVTATGNGRGSGDYLTVFETTRNLQRRSLAGELTLVLAVRPEPLDVAGDEAAAVVEVELSEHLLDGRLVQPSVRFLLGAAGEPWRDGAVYSVPVAAAIGVWQEHRLELTEAVRRGFPEFAAEDNSLHRLSLGVQVAGRARASVLFDDLRVLQGRPGADMFAAQLELLARAEAADSELVHLQGAELSYTPLHLNEFSLDTRQPDYDALSRLAAQGLRKPCTHEPLLRCSRCTERETGFDEALTRLLVEDIHARGGLVSFNHPFGAGPAGPGREAGREGTLEELSSSRVFGVDLLEVGYRDRGGHPLEDHLWLWDQLARAGNFLVGIGVSDAHAAGAREDAANDMISWIYAPAPTKPALLEGLRRGRVYFGDPDHFEGSLDLVTSQGFRMGSVVVSEAASERVTVIARGLRPGDLVRVAGTWADAPELTAAGTELERELELPLDEPVELIRLEVHSTAGQPAAFSNPIVFVRDPALASGLAGSGRLQHGAR